MSARPLRARVAGRPRPTSERTLVRSGAPNGSGVLSRWRCGVGGGGTYGLYADAPEPDPSVVKEDTSRPAGSAVGPRGAPAVAMRARADGNGDDKPSGATSDGGGAACMSVLMVVCCSTEGTAVWSPNAAGRPRRLPWASCRARRPARHEAQADGQAGAHESLSDLGRAQGAAARTRLTALVMRASAVGGIALGRL